MFGQLARLVLGPVLDIVDKSITDKDLRERLRHQITQQILVNEAHQLESKAQVIMAEASGESWLQRSWRPLTMLFFVGLIAAHWLGFTPPNISEPQILALLDIVQIGLGGYVVGRSAEKVARTWTRKDG